MDFLVNFSLLLPILTLLSCSNWNACCAFSFDVGTPGTVDTKGFGLRAAFNRFITMDSIEDVNTIVYLSVRTCILLPYVGISLSAKAFLSLVNLGYSNTTIRPTFCILIHFFRRCRSQRSCDPLIKAEREWVESMGIKHCKVDHVGSEILASPF